MGATIFLLTGCSPKPETTPASLKAKQIVSQLTPDQMAQAASLFGTGGTLPTTKKNGKALTDQERDVLADPKAPMSKKLEIYYDGASLTGRIAPSSGPPPARVK